ncbi:hypothetical protein AUEXF2481DRAFT_654914 [Aureobasidium subglaciale EXF-2481]|uniref:Uncharacterized protein n=1 Tax=Aureobasidium subglaciale (strain EXF-2481) TaxID=1043005 RepID=A0A074ZB47_AURSE|nr:uncharacterized protein AUEXF2481DRAFT_654914 [Aureobasidium subglaciale EXF-2481]KEQ95971.1 hypothetical protein AUEXF2481DRAFT_654914 [Aureobasidium subglaciale EXF-2481]
MNAIFRMTAIQRVKHIILPDFKTRALTTSIVPKRPLKTAVCHETVLKGTANPVSRRLLFHTPTKHYVATEISNTKATPVAAEISMSIDGQEEIFSALLFRDMCHYPLYIHPSTRQKLYPTADIPTSIRPRSVHVSESAATLTWGNDVPGFDHTHSTILQTDDLETLAKTGALPGPFVHALPSQVLWDSTNAKVKDTSFDDYMANDAALLRVLNLYEHTVLSSSPTFLVRSMQ